LALIQMRRKLATVWRLNRNELEAMCLVAFVHEPGRARTENAVAVEQDQILI
jgi:hypothetical protein